MEGLVSTREGMGAVGPGQRPTEKDAAVTVSVPAGGVWGSCGWVGGWWWGGGGVAGWASVCGGGFERLKAPVC